MFLSSYPHELTCGVTKEDYIVYSEVNMNGGT